MNSNERTLRAVRTQVQFELAQVAAEVALAAKAGDRMQHQVTALSQRCDLAATELRSVTKRSQINLALVDAMHRLYHVEQNRLRDSQAQLAAAQQREEQARAAMAGVRNRERSLERALQAERRKEQQRQQALEIIQADDMWLQHAWRELQ